MDKSDIAALDQTIEAHLNWLKRNGLETNSEAFEMTVIEAYSLLQNAGIQLERKRAKLGIAVLSSFHRLCALRSRRVGLERARADFEVKLATLPALAAHASAIRIAQDDSHRAFLVKRFARLDKHATSAFNGLREFEARSLVRCAALKRHGYAAVGVPETARALACSQWLRGRLAQLVDEMALFLADISGAVASETIGHPGPTDSRAWRLVRDDCMCSVKDAGAPFAEVQRLFPDAAAGSKASKKDLAVKRVSRARRRNKSAG